MQFKFCIAVFSAMIFISSLSSCQKDNHIDSEKPIITIEKPIIGDTISVSSLSGVELVFSVAENDDLHEVVITIKDYTGANVYARSAHVHGKVCSFQEYFQPAGITSLTDFTLEIEAADHHNNVAKETVKFFVKP
jgi:hypothetical protein